MSGYMTIIKLGHWCFQVEQAQRTKLSVRLSPRVWNKATGANARRAMLMVPNDEKPGRAEAQPGPSPFNSAQSVIGFWREQASFWCAVSRFVPPDSGILRIAKGYGCHGGLQTPCTFEFQRNIVRLRHKPQFPNLPLQSISTGSPSASSCLEHSQVVLAVDALDLIAPSSTWMFLERAIAQLLIWSFFTSFYPQRAYCTDFNLWEITRTAVSAISRWSISLPDFETELSELVHDFTPLNDKKPASGKPAGGPECHHRQGDHTWQAFKPAERATATEAGERLYPPRCVNRA